MPLDRVYRAYMTILGSLEWVDSQMRFRMRYAPHPPKEKTYRLNMDADGDYLGDIPLEGVKSHPHLRDNWSE